MFILLVFTLGEIKVICQCASLSWGVVTNVLSWIEPTDTTVMRQVPNPHLNCPTALHFDKKCKVIEPL